MSDNVRVPQSGTPATADWAGSVAAAIRALRISAGPGIRITPTPGGMTISAIQPPRRPVASAEAEQIIPTEPEDYLELHPDGEDADDSTADTAIWTAGSGDEGEEALKLWVTARILDDTYAGKIYAFMRALTFDRYGQLQSVSAETKVEISASVTHESQHPES
jgi:hypothetical protein